MGTELDEVVLYDPTTLLIIGSVTAGAEILTGITQGNLAQETAKAESSFLQAKSLQEQKARDREFADLKREEARQASRARAVLAAQGGDTAGGSGLSVLTSQASAFARQRSRLIDDSQVAQAALTARSRATKAAGSAQQSQFIFGGFARAAGTAASTASLLPGRPTAARPVGSNPPRVA